MKLFQLDQMHKGWFIGNFVPTVVNTEAVEVAVKTYTAGQKEEAHFHKVATEVTVVVSGSVRMCGQTYEAGAIIVLSPGEVTDFEALTDAVNVVVKYPGAPDDKYLVSDSAA